MLTAEEVHEVTPPASTAVLPPPKVRPVLSVVRVMSRELSWYGPGFYGKRSASGKNYRPGTMTAAHRTQPFGTKMRHYFCVWPVGRDPN